MLLYYFSLQPLEFISYPYCQILILNFPSKVNFLIA